MAEAEQIVQEGQAKKEEKKPNLVELVLKEASELASTTFNTGLGLGLMGASYALGGLDWLVTTASFPVGGFFESKMADKPFISKKFRDEIIGGFGFTIPLVLGVNLQRRLPQALGIDGLVNILGYGVPASALAAGLLTFASIPLFNAFYYPIKYLADNKTFKGMAKDFKERYTKDLIPSLVLGLFLAPTVAASVAFPAMYPFLFPILAGFEVAYRVVLSKEELRYRRLFKYLNPLYYSGLIASSAGNLLGKSLRGLKEISHDTGYALGSPLSPAPSRS